MLEILVISLEDGDVAATADVTANHDGKPGAKGQADVAEELAAPVPRFSAPLAVLGHRIFMYGGIFEGGRHQQREVTLDDCWSLDLRQLQRWDKLLGGSWQDQQWLGDDDSSSDESEDDYDFTSSEDDEDEDEDEDDNDQEGAGGVGDSAAGAVAGATQKGAGAVEAEGDETKGGGEDQKEKKKKKKKKKDKKGGSKALREEIAALRETLALADEQQTPLAGEKLRDFFARTSRFWGDRAASALQQGGATGSMDAAAAATTAKYSDKELRAMGFQLASERFEELAPTLNRLNVLEEEQKRAEEKAQTKSKSSHSSGKKGHKSPSRSGGGGGR